MTREVRENLNRLSKEVFGSSSKWKKICDQGVAEPFERDREVTVPDGKGGVKTKTFTDKKLVVKHYTPDEVCKMMLEILVSRQKKPSVLNPPSVESTALSEDTSNFKAFTDLPEDVMLVNPKTFKSLEEILSSV
jgi:hypothetical protein